MPTYACHALCGSVGMWEEKGGGGRLGGGGEGGVGVYAACATGMRMDRGHWRNAGTRVPPRLVRCAPEVAFNLSSALPGGDGESLSLRMRAHEVRCFRLLTPCL